jgi:hypothetical protein
MDKNNIYRILRYGAVSGNAVYFLWVLRNGINEGFRKIGTVQGVALCGLMVLLILNIVLLTRRADNYIR